MQRLHQPVKRFNRAIRLGVTVAIAAAVTGGCASDGMHVPDVGPEPIEYEANRTETGSRIPRGRDEKIRNAPQRVDVFTEQDLEKQAPANTRDAVQRATRGF